MSNTLTWLHLSDLHMRRDALDDLRVVLDALWRDLPQQIEAMGGRLDFIAFAGDVAHSGQAEEYELAIEHFFRPLLQVSGVSAGRLFLVPGNHDVDRGVIELINPGLAALLTNRDQVNALLRDDARRRLLFQPLANYARFVQTLLGSFPDHRALHDPLYAYAQPISTETPTVALIGLNTAWFSGFTRDAAGNVIDRGNLLLGDKQIGDGLMAAQDAAVRIALMHHPPSWLKEFDERDVERWLRPGCHIVLRGHLHDPGFEREQALAGETITVPAGTIYASREWLNGYNILQLDFEAQEGQLLLRRYSESRRQWVMDVQASGDELMGLVRFDLPNSLVMSSTPRAAFAPAAAPLSPQAPPDWLRLGREAKLQLLQSFLGQEEEATLWIWGNRGCGLTEFMQAAQVLLEEAEGLDVVHFDAQDTALGVTVDQLYFLRKLEQWAGLTPHEVERRTAEDIDEHLRSAVAQMAERLQESQRRLVLAFHNYHLLVPTVRVWAWRTLWEEILEPLMQRGALAIFSCEGAAPACPASEQENCIYLADFTIQDVEHFLHGLPALSASPEQVSALASRIHSGERKEFLASPQLVYQNLIVQLIGLGFIDLQPNAALTGPGKTRPALTAGQRRRLRKELSELQQQYERLSKRIVALNTDIDRTLDSVGRQILEERQAEEAAKREQVAADMSRIEAQLSEWTAVGNDR